MLVVETGYGFDSSDDIIVGSCPGPVLVPETTGRSVGLGLSSTEVFRWLLI